MASISTSPVITGLDLPAGSPGGSVELLHDLYAGPPAPLPGQAFILAPKRDRGRAVPGPVLLTVAESAPTGRRSGGTWPP